MRKLMVLVLALALAVPVRAAEYEAKSWVLVDGATGTVLEKGNEQERLAPASVTKVMTLLLIMEAVDTGQISMDDTVTVSAYAAGMGGSQVYLKEGEQMSVSELIKCVTVVSGNDCAVALAEHIAGSESAFVTRMNQRAAQLGMADTTFLNCTGLPAQGHVTSAYDIALMSRELLTKHPDIKRFTTIWMDTVRNGEFGLSNTNKLIRFYSGATGLKTGFTSGAGYCLSATAEREGMELIAVVMGAETSQIRNTACKQLLDYGFANFAVVAPEMGEEAVVPVRLGTEQGIRLVPGENPRLLIDKALKSGITTDISLEPEVTAPVSQGQQLGTLTIRSGETILARVPLVAEMEIPRLRWRNLFVLTLRKLAMGS